MVVVILLRRVIIVLFVSMCGCVSVQTKHIQTTIKCIGFEPIHYAINVDDVSSFMGFSKFDYMFLIMYC